MAHAAEQRMNRAATWVGPLVLICLIVWFAGWTVRGGSSAAIDALWVLLTSGPMALAWLGAAVGFGWPLRALLLEESEAASVIQAALGIAALLVIDASLGSLGLMQAGGAAGAWVVVACGLGLLLVQMWRWVRTRPVIQAPPWLIWTAAPSVAVLLVAASSAPGWLWASEFGGYDALSYHLQLPKEWLALGRIQPLQHNVYSFLPGYMEAAYYHIAVMMGDGIRSVYACQLLHAAFAVLTAATTGSIATKMIGGESSSKLRNAGVAASVVVLGTPWVIVVGSLGYNEMAVTFMLAAGLRTILEPALDSWRRGAVIGILCAAACGAKLTSLGLVAVPLAVLLLAVTPARRWLPAIVAGSLAGIIVLSPHLLRNYAAADNPVFPFASGLFGLGHWTAEQHAVFARGHISDSGPLHRVVELWNQFLRYGMGPNPYADEPWKPQWSILPWLGVIGIALGLATPRLRRSSAMLAAVLIVQILFWICFTHLKSRFLLPAVVPLALGVVVGFAWCSDRFSSHVDRRDRARRALLAIALSTWSLWPVLVFRSERDGAPAALIGGAGLLSGDDLDPRTRREQAESSLPAVAINYLLPADAKVLLIGDAKPLYYRDKIAYQTTWDRGPLSQLMRQYPDDASGWLRGMRDRGFTHLLVDEPMLLRWERAGWNDPLITRDRVVDAAGRMGTVEHRYPGDVTLYRLKP